MFGVRRAWACLVVCACGGSAERGLPSMTETSGGTVSSGGGALMGGGVNPAGGTSSSGETSSAGDGALSGEGAATTGGSSAQNWATDCPGEPGAELTAPSTCSALLTCTTDGAVPESCSFSPLSVTLTQISSQCDVYCGILSVGIKSGCVADIYTTHLGVFAPQTTDHALACMKGLLFGTRWDCAPSDGWVAAYLGSCTIGR